LKRESNILKYKRIKIRRNDSRQPEATGGCDHFKQEIFEMQAFSGGSHSCFDNGFLPGQVVFSPGKAGNSVEKVTKR